MSKEWNLLKERYKISGKIGQGASGEVLKAKHRLSGTQVAIKYVKNDWTSDYTSKKIVREVQILRHLTLMKENIHTVKMLDLVVSDSMTDIFIVMNYTKSTTDFKTFLRKKSSSFEND